MLLKSCKVSVHSHSYCLPFRKHLSKHLHVEHICNQNALKHLEAPRLKMLGFNCYRCYRCPKKCPLILRREKENCFLIHFENELPCVLLKRASYTAKKKGLKMCKLHYKSIKFCCYRGKWTRSLAENIVPKFLLYVTLAYDDI